MLPGLRALRAPLASGYLSLLALWLAYSNDVPDREDASGLVRRVYELEGLGSEVGVGLAVSFVAYLIGTLTEWGTTSALRELVSNRFLWYGKWIRSRALEVKRDPDVDYDIVDTIVEGERFGRAWRRGEFSTIRTLLLVEHPLLYNEYDRLTSEAEFRTAIILPLAWLITILGREFDTAFFAALVAVIALAIQAFQLERRGMAILVQSVTSGKVTSPYVNDVRTLTTDVAPPIIPRRPKS